LTLKLERGLDIPETYLHTENEVIGQAIQKSELELKKYKTSLKVKGQGQMSATSNDFEHSPRYTFLPSYINFG